jgi:hypothetical protein
MSGATGSVSLHRPDLTPLFAKISALTLICVAVCHPYWTPADAAGAAGCLPNGASVIVTRSGHIAPLFEAAPAVVDLLTVSGANPGAVVTRQRARRDGLGTSPASNLTANASEGEFRSPGHRKARQPPRRRCVSARMARAAHPSTRGFRPAMALPGASALTGGVS